MTGRKLSKKPQFFLGKKVWNELLSKYMIYAPKFTQIHVLKLVLEANGKFDWYKIGKMAKKPPFFGGKGLKWIFKQIYDLCIKC